MSNDLEITLYEADQNRSDAQVGFQQGEERNRSTAFGMSFGFATVFISVLSAILTPISFGFEQVNQFLVDCQNLVNNFLIGTDGIFTPLIENAIKYKDGGFFDLVFYIVAFDKVLPFAITNLIPFILTLVDIFINWVIIILNCLGILISYNVGRRVLSFLPWFKAI